MKCFLGRLAATIAAVLAWGFNPAGATQLFGQPQPLCVMNIDGTEFREIASPAERPGVGSPCWSPDGKRIAFDAAGRDFYDQHVYVVELETGEVKDMGPGGFPSWSPSGDQIVYHRYYRNPYHVDMWMVNSDGSEKHELLVGRQNPRWSRDGKTIAYLPKTLDNIGLYHVETGKHSMLFDEPTPSLSWGRSWSPDGKRLAVLRRTSTDGVDELVLINARGSSRGLRVRFRGNMSSHASWTAGGDLILIGIYLPEDGPRHLHYLDPDGRGKPTIVPGQDPMYDYCDGAFSPDGKQIAFGYKRRKPAKPAAGNGLIIE